MAASSSRPRPSLFSAKVVAAGVRGSDREQSQGGVVFAYKFMHAAGPSLPAPSGCCDAAAEGGHCTSSLVATFNVEEACVHPPPPHVSLCCAYIITEDCVPPQHAFLTFHSANAGAVNTLLPLATYNASPLWAMPATNQCNDWASVSALWPTRCALATNLESTCTAPPRSL